MNEVVLMGSVEEPSTVNCFEREVVALPRARASHIATNAVDWKHHPDDIRHSYLLHSFQQWHQDVQSCISFSIGHSIYLN